MKKILVLFSFFAFVCVLGLVSKPAYAAKSACKTIQSGTLLNSYGDTLSTGYDQWGYNYQASIFNGKLCDSYHDAAWCQKWKDVNLQMNWNNAWLSNQSCDGNNEIDRHFGFASYRGSGAWLTNHATGTYTGTGNNFHWDVNSTIDTVDVLYQGSHYLYSANFSLTGTDLTGSLTDPYVQPIALTGPILNGNFDGTNVTFSFDYGLGSVQGVRTYVGTIDSSGNASGTWSQTGSQGGGDSWSISGFATKVFNMCTVSDFVKIVAAPKTAFLDTGVSGYFGEGMWYTDSSKKTEIGPVLWGDFAVIQEVASDPCGEYGVIDYMSFLRKGLGNWSY